MAHEGGSQREVVVLSGEPYPEAEKLVELEHPHVVDVLELGEKDGRPFVAKEVVHGRPIDRVVKVGRVELGEFFGLALPMVQGMAAAHERGVAHRDLRSANVIITSHGAKVVGFRLCPTEEDPAAAPHYRAPEQLRGEQGDLRSDVFSLGVILFELSAGVRPFDGPTLADVGQAVLARRPLAPATIDPQLPLELSRIVMKALEKDPKKRYPSAVELLADLVALRDDPAKQAEIGLSPGTSVMRDGARLAALGVGALLVLIVLWAIFGAD